MIVGTYFDGDDDREVAWLQEAVYGDALARIVEECNDLASLARAILDDVTYEEWGTVSRFDHRVLQDAHDLLAAVWRYRAPMRQLPLPFDDDTAADLSTRVHRQWLAWLQVEVATWREAPTMVRQVQLALAHQNSGPGYEAEDRLRRLLRSRFPDVPWSYPEFDGQPLDSK